MATINRPIDPNFDRGTQMPPSESLTGAMQKVKDQAKEVAGTAADLAGQAKGKVQEMASHMASQVKDRTQEFAAVAADKAQDLGQELTQLVRRYPIPALLVGFGIGLCLGRMSRT